MIDSDTIFDTSLPLEEGLTATNRQYNINWSDRTAYYPQVEINEKLAHKCLFLLKAKLEQYFSYDS